MILVLHTSHTNPVILNYSQLWGRQLYFFIVVEAYSTPQTISGVIYTPQETYLSKKNTVVVILASAYSPPRVGAVQKKKWIEDQIFPEPLKSSSSGGISIWRGSFPDILGCRKGSFKCPFQLTYWKFQALPCLDSSLTKQKSAFWIQTFSLVWL